MYNGSFFNHKTEFPVNNQPLFKLVPRITVDWEVFLIPQPPTNWFYEKAASTAQ
jgi:hypothetical protein